MRSLGANSDPVSSGMEAVIIAMPGRATTRFVARSPYFREDGGALLDDRVVMSGCRCIAFHKPYGVLSQFTGGEGKGALKQFGFPAGVYAAGRLDADSEGLLLLTNDGSLIHRLLDPRFAHPRTYWAQVERVPDGAALEALAAGPRLGDGPTRRCEVRLLGSPLRLCLPGSRPCVFASRCRRPGSRSRCARVATGRCAG